MRKRTPADAKAVFCKKDGELVKKFEWERTIWERGVAAEARVQDLGEGLGLLGGEGVLRVARALAHVQLLDGLALVLDDVREVRLRPEHGLELGVRHLAITVGVDLGHERGHRGRGLRGAELGQEAGDFLRRDAAGAVRVEGLEEFLDVGHICA